MSILLFKEESEIENEIRELFEKYSLNQFHDILVMETDIRNEEEMLVVEYFENFYNPEKKELIK
jgi:hypothetical protein